MSRGNGRAAKENTPRANVAQPNGAHADLSIQYRPVAALVPYARNARTHSEAQIDQIANSMREFGWTNPILVDGANGIIAGHGRVLAALKLGVKQVPTIELAHLSDAQKRDYIIADNKLALNAGWDEALLKLELMDLKGLDFDIDLLGFAEEEITNLLAPSAVEGLTDPDVVPEPPKAATTKAGDLWILGRHRLLCGDSGSEEHVGRLLGGATIQLVNTDPPYNVRVEPRSNNAIVAGISSFPASAPAMHHQGFDLARDPRKLKATTKQLRPKDRPLENDFISDEEFAQRLRAWFGLMARALDPGRAFYIWGGYANVANYPSALRESHLYFSQAIIWVKEHPVLTRKDFMGNHEWCFYGWREGAAHVYVGPTNATDVWPVKKISPNKMVHLTEKPTELATRAMQYSSRPGENVLDLFGGSGSTLIAAEQNNRCAFLTELDPLYSDVIIMRWQDFTGENARLEDGRSFDEVRSERLVMQARRGRSGRKAPRKKAMRRARGLASWNWCGYLLLVSALRDCLGISIGVPVRIPFLAIQRYHCACLSPKEESGRAFLTAAIISSFVMAGLATIASRAMLLTLIFFSVLDARGFFSALVFFSALAFASTGARSGLDAAVSFPFAGFCCFFFLGIVISSLWVLGSLKSVGSGQLRTRFGFPLDARDCDGDLLGKLVFVEAVKARMIEAHPRLDQFGIHPDVALSGTLFADHLLVHIGFPFPLRHTWSSDNLLAVKGLSRIFCGPGHE